VISLSDFQRARLQELADSLPAKRQEFVAQALAYCERRYDFETATRLAWFYINQKQAGTILS
jgi:predicted transcriptional regulator